jgi:hypothetical protein
MDNPKPSAKLEAIRQKIRSKGASVSRFLDSPDGSVVMAALEAEFFDGPMMAATPEATAFNLGRRDVVVYLKQLRDYSRKEILDVDPLS